MAARDATLVPPPRARRGAARWLAGDGRERSYVLAHGLHSASNSAVGMALAGAAIFTVDGDAPRAQLIAYLGFTLVPFALACPVLGWLLGRAALGRRLVPLAFVGRAVLALLLLALVGTPLLYPLAFGILALQKAHTVGIYAMVDQLAPSRAEMGDTNARLTRIAAVAGAFGAAGALGLAVLTTPRAGFVVAAVGYLLGAKVAARAAAATTAVVHDDDDAAVTGSVLTSLLVVASMRGCVGALMFTLASMADVTAGESVRTVAAVALAVATGGAIGTVIGPAALRALPGDQLRALLCLGVSLACCIAAGLPYLGVLVPAALCVGLAGSVARQSRDRVIQDAADESARQRVFLFGDAMAQIAWVSGAAVAVALATSAAVGFMIMATIAVAGAVVAVVGATSAQLRPALVRVTDRR